VSPTRGTILGSLYSYSECLSATPVPNATHDWNFQDCNPNEPVADSANGTLAMLKEGPICSPEGVTFDGTDDYVDIDDFMFGGPTSFEIYVRYDGFNNWSPAICFGSGKESNNVFVANNKDSSNIEWRIGKGNDKRELIQGVFDEGSWNHIVVTVKGTTMRTYKDGSLVGTKTDGMEPERTSRTQRYLGRSNWQEQNLSTPQHYFKGALAYVKMWDLELSQSNVAILFNKAISCAATSNPGDDGSNGNFYCVNGGNAGGKIRECTCTSCDTGFGGMNCAACVPGFSGPDCSAATCTSTQTPTDDGTDGNFFCANWGIAAGRTGNCTCSCAPGYSGTNCKNPHHVEDMTRLFDTTSNREGNGVTNTGKNIMSNGDTVKLAKNSYKCNEGGNCAASTTMLYLFGLSGSIVCTNDDASCVIDGEKSRRAIMVWGTGEQKLIIRALTFQNGLAKDGGGMYIWMGALVDLVLCTFRNCKSSFSTSSSNHGGGAILVEIGNIEVPVVNLWGTYFTRNSAAKGNGNDIMNLFNGGNITIHDLCPFPFSSNFPTQGPELSTTGTIKGSNYSYTDCYQDACFLSPCGNNADCLPLVENKYRYTCSCKSGYRGDATFDSKPACRLIPGKFNLP